MSYLLPLTIVSCSGVPGSFSAFNPLDSFKPTQTIGRFQIQNDLVVDVKSKLMWTRCLLGETWNGFTCMGNANLYSWHLIQSASKSARYGGYADWRTPTLDELKTLADVNPGLQNTTIPYLNQAVFPTPNCYGGATEMDSNNKACWHWTSSLIEGSDHYAWSVYFGYGYGSINYGKEAVALRLVRDY